jgi:hypothetical protein
VSESKVRSAFSQQVVVLPVASIVPQKQISGDLRKTATYKRISTSLEHIGLIEPLVVYPRGPNDYLLLDGHVRLDILTRRGTSEVRVVFATDDEAYTYNKYVNHSPPVAEHFMILKALASGVSEERIAEVLNVEVAAIRQKRSLLAGICPEAVEILRNSDVPAGTFAVLRKMKSMRQIESAEHMHDTGTFSIAFAKALLEVTRSEFLLEVPSKRKIEANSAAAQAMLEEETDSLVRDMKTVEESYGTDMLTLSISCGYLERLLGNPRVERHLDKYHSEILSEVRTLLTEVRPEKAKPLAS